MNPLVSFSSFTIPDFCFRSGAVMEKLRMSYLVVGTPDGEPVLLLHGTGGSARHFLAPGFAGELFGPGQPLDSSKYCIVVPDSLGHGNSAKPSDGLRADFPSYGYQDMVEAQFRLVTEGLGIKRFRLVMGNSMGGMHAWLWGENYPEMMDLLVPMASQPTAMAGRNWILRRLIGEIIRSDSDYLAGNYVQQPRVAQLISIFFSFATNGGNIALHRAAPTRAEADALLDAQLSVSFSADANDLLYQWGASADFDALGDLKRITARVLAINSEDDERNPPGTGAMTEAMRLLKDGWYLTIPASAETRGHGTTWDARWYAAELGALMRNTPKLGHVSNYRTMAIP